MKTHPRDWPTTHSRNHCLAAEMLDRQVAHQSKHGHPMSLRLMAEDIGILGPNCRRVAMKLATLGYLEQRPGTTLYWAVVDADGNSLTGEKL